MKATEVVVDAVTEVLRLAAGSVEPASSVITTSDSEYLLGIAKLESRLIILLDLEQALSTMEQGKITDKFEVVDDEVNKIPPKRAAA